MIWKYFLPLCELSSLCQLLCSLLFEALKFEVFALGFCFLLLALPFSVLLFYYLWFNTIIIWITILDIFCVFSSIILTVWRCKFMVRINFELNLHIVRYSNTNLYLSNVHFFQYLLFEILSLLHCVVLIYLLKINWTQVCGCISDISILFHCFCTKILLVLCCF